MPMNSPCSTAPGISSRSGPASGIGNPAEVAVENVVALVGPMGLAGGIHSHLDGAAPRAAISFPTQRLGKRDHFDRDRGFPEHRDGLAGVGNDHQSPRGGSDTLLPQESHLRP